MAFLAAMVAAGSMGCAGMMVEPIPPPSFEPAELVVRNARVVTLDPMRPEAKAFAVAAGRFRMVGSEAQVAAYIGPTTRVVDARRAVVLPGLIDAHLHLLGEGFRLQRLDLVGTTSKDDVLALVQRAAAASPGTGFLRGRGWDQNDWDDQRFPTREDLDRVVPDRPVALERIDGHALWVNGKALELGGIDGSTRDPEGGQILRDASGQATGVLVDNAADLVARRIPPATHDEKLEAARRAAEECVAAGLTGVHEPGIGLDDIAVLKELYRAGKMPLRIYAMLSPGEALEHYLQTGPEIGLFDERLTIRAVKFYADGALGSRGAALLAPYADDPANRGLHTTEPAVLEREVRRVALAGLQPCVHAIGDAANREVLDLYERVMADGVARGMRPRIEHAQVVSPKDIARFGRLGVVASMQPTHATSDMPWAEARLGPARLAGAYAWHSIAESGGRLAFGSDAPVESVSPFLGIQAAVTRADVSGNPAGGWQPGERVSIDTALRAFTAGAAYAAFEEEVKGTIAPGRLADFVVVADDPRTMDSSRLHSLRVLSTWVGGVAVYEAVP